MELNFNMSIFDDDDKRMTEIDDRCKDYRRLGSFFAPWYWDIQEKTEYSLLWHVDLDPLENLCDNIKWIHYEDFISDNGVNRIDIRNWFAHYISHIILNEYILEDEVFEYLKTGHIPKNSLYTVKLEKTGQFIIDNLKEYFDDAVRDELTTNLYVTKSDFDGRLVLHFNIKHPRFESISVIFNNLNKK